MDIRTVGRKLRANKYRSFKAYQSDVELIFKNYLGYFNGNTNIARRCKELRSFYFKKLDELTNKGKKN
jgi:antibiotic biosynthesis monooxygenase (ABM) superfamily enzyme